MNLQLDSKKIALILKGYFLFYSFEIGNCTVSDLGKKKYSFTYVENTSIYNFGKMLSEKHKEYISVDWLFDYFNYQFTYWSFYKTQKEKLGEQDVKICANWILGKKALTRFLSKTQRDSYFYHSVFFPKYQICKKDLIKTLEDKGLFLSEMEEEIISNPLNEIEEKIKSRRYNTIEGLYNCLESTSLFKFNSSICGDCIFNQKCKDILKIRYPILYQKRLANKIKEDGKGDISSIC